MPHTSSVHARLTTALAGRYRIERELGQGGMATVFLAEDVKHKRHVAVKVLKPELAAVLGAERFIQEITTTAALQHPHILPLFDSGEADGFLYYVMPFIDGETLRTKLDRETQLSVDDAVRITCEVADALHYAHSNGVVHRDIKPENILLHDGRPMVADFGIALAVSAAAGGRMTETGLSLGTPHYMSPEQATAEKVITARSDVYSLASVLFEMLAGHPPHTGGSAQQIIMKIITEVAPPVTTLRKSVPAHVAGAIEKALEKLPADRFATAREFADVLLGRTQLTREARAGGASHKAVRARDWLLLGVTGVAMIAVATAGWFGMRTPSKDTAPAAMFVLNSAAAQPVMTGTWPALVSPDGRRIVYAGDAGNGIVQLFVRSVDEINVRALPGTVGATQTIFSPDSKWIAFEAGGQLRKVQLDAGTPVPIINANAQNGATWTPGGEIILGSEGAVNGLTRVSDAGGEVTQLTKPKGGLLHLWPLVMVDGKSIIFSEWEGSGKSNFASRLATTSLSDGAVRQLDLAGVRALGTSHDRLFYLQADGTVMAVPFDTRSMKVKGKPVPVLDSISLCRTCNGDAPIYLSSSGALAYIRGALPQRLTWTDLAGASTVVSPREQTFAYPRISPDGRRIAVTIDSRLRDIWIYEIGTDTWTRLTNGANNWGAEWSADGRNIIYVSDRAGQVRAWTQPSDFTGSARAISPIDDGLKSAAPSPDGKTLLFSTFTDNVSHVWSGSIGDSAPRVAIDTGTSWAGLAHFSPDGRMESHTSTASGQYEVFISPFPGQGGRVQVSENGGTDAVWSRDGKRLFYVVGRRMMVATLTPPPNVRVLARDSLFEVEPTGDLSGVQFDVSPDGKRLLTLRTDSRRIQLVIALDWAEKAAAKAKRQ